MDVSSESSRQCTDLRPLGSTGICVSAIAMGCWPITGITSVDVTLEASLATLAAAFDSGINFFDTAFCYGYNGESERMIGRVFRGRRERIVIATKCGIHWEAPGKQVKDGRPQVLRQQCVESLRRLGTDCVDLLYLHAPDPNTPIEESAGALRRLLEEGKTRAVGLSNAGRDQLAAFAAVCPLTAYQPHYNMLQREIEASELPWCVESKVAVFVYWPLMKGLLAGRMPHDFTFDPRDGRQKYPMYQGEEWTRNQDLVDRLRQIAAKAGKTTAQLVLAWTIDRPGITGALCGAKRPEQIRENSGAMGWSLSPELLGEIDAALAARGPAASYRL